MEEETKASAQNTLWIGLACGALAACVALGGFFFVRERAADSRQEEQNRLLEQARQEIETLKDENGRLTRELEEWESAQEVMAAGKEDSQQEEDGLLRIPFDVDLAEWNYLLVNELHPLAKGYTPDLENTRNGQKVDRRIKADLEAMLDAAKEDGMNLLICSSYRTYQKQDSLMDRAIERYRKQGMDYTEAFFQAKKQIALTGTSEHHTGLAVDIVGSSHQSLDSAQADTPEAKWLKEHAREYGFILRYPKEKEEQTMISFESWHFRYVGKQAAVFIEENGLCLEEFLELADRQQKQEEDPA